MPFACRLAKDAGATAYAHNSIPAVRHVRLGCWEWYERTCNLPHFPRIDLSIDSTLPRHWAAVPDAPVVVRNMWLNERCVVVRLRLVTTPFLPDRGENHEVRLKQLRSLLILISRH